MESPWSKVMSAVTRRIDSALGKSVTVPSHDMTEISGVLRSGATESSAADAKNRWRFEWDLFEPGPVHSEFYCDNDFHPLSSGLGPEADRLIELSPSLSRTLTQVQYDDWLVGRAESGSISHADRTAKTILIDSSLDDPTAVGELAHWISHVNRANRHLWEVKRRQCDKTREQWARAMVTRHIRGEINAMKLRYRARLEILSEGGPDIGVDHELVQQWLGDYGGYTVHDYNWTPGTTYLSDALEKQSEYYPHGVARPGVPYEKALLQLYRSIAANSPDPI